MFGSREEFEYFECASCGCVQILDYPDNIGQYYPKQYYSYTPAATVEDSFLTKYLRRKRALHSIFGRSLVGAFIAQLMPPPPMFKLLNACGVKQDARILEIGSGSGGFLISLQKLGFTDLTGLDPFVDETRNNDKGISILKKNIAAVQGEYDLIIAKDTIEHMPLQQSVFNNINRLLGEKGTLLITIPVIGYAWRYYGVNWSGLDAPRHYYLHTLKSLNLLCEQTGFDIFYTRFDSNEDQFIGSEQYKRDIPLLDKQSYFENKSKSIFSEADIKRFKIRAAELNNKQDGDRVSVCMRKRC